MSAYRKDRTPGVYIRHEQACPAADADGPRCRCNPSFRAKTRSHGWSRTFRTRAEAEGWKLDVKRGLVPLPQDIQPVSALTFRSITEQWWQAVENAEIGTRKRRRPYSPNTLRQYRVALDLHVLPVMGDKRAADVTLRDWQRFVDGLHRKGLKTNSVNNYINPVRAVYGWACSPRREILPVNAIAGVELPPVDETKRERVATPAEAKALLAALSPDDRVIWALAFYTGCRASEIGRVEWSRVDFKQGGLFVPESKSDAGVRWVPMVAPLRAVLLDAWQRRGLGACDYERGLCDGKCASCPFGTGRVVRGSIKAAKERALGRSVKGRHVPGIWERAGLEPIGLHECRHTFISYMAAAGVGMKVQSQIAGHEEETITLKRYTHTLPGAVAEAGRMLDAYLEASG